MKIPNMDEMVEAYLGKETKYRKNKWYLPKNPFRMVVCGPSGTGKTNMALFMLLKAMKYDKLVLCAKMTNEPKYEFLRRLFEELKAEGVEDCFEAYDSLDSLPSVDEQPDDGRTKVIVFDDLVNEKDQEKIKNYFTRGRKKGFSCLYLAQRFTEVPKMVRNNAVTFIIFNQRPKEISIIHPDLVNGDMELEEFRKMFKTATGDRQSFLLIDKSEDIPAELRYRKGLDTYFIRD